VTDTGKDEATEITTLESRIVYENRWMRVREDKIERADGSTGIYGVVDKVDYVVVIPRISGQFFMIEQFRYPAGGRYWEFPQGAWETVPDATPEEVAHAELREETGLRASRMHYLGHLYEAYGFCSQAFDVFAADDCVEGPAERSSEEQGMRGRKFTLEELGSMIRAGTVRDGPSIAAFGLLMLD
jgi:ADP-ribose pyrophosphatase